MSGLLTTITVLSLIALLVLALRRAKQQKTWRLFTLQMSVLAAFAVFLHLLFDFPKIQPGAIAKGDGVQEIYFVIVLYIFMLLGMLAQYGYTRFEKPKAERPAFDPGLFIAPVFASPIIFIPLLAALQNAEMDLSKLDAPRLMMFFVAFENGFFWKEYFDHRRKAKEGGEDGTQI